MPRSWGLDFSHSAIEAARKLAAELGLTARARFVEADLYDAPAAVAEPASFDRVFVTWEAINWLPDIARWAHIVAHFLKPGGSLYLAECHPAALESLIKRFVSHVGQISGRKICFIIPRVEGSFGGTNGSGERQVHIGGIG